MDIKKVHPELDIYRGAQPEIFSEYFALKSKGIVSIVNLRSDWLEDHDKDLKRSQELTRAAELAQRCFMWDAIMPPTFGMLWEAMEHIEQHLLFGAVYIHCRHGVDRTGSLSAFIRVRHGLETPFSAIKYMIQNGFHYGRYFFWVPMLYSSFRRAAKDRRCQAK